MNRIVLLAMLAALTVTSAYAQQRYDPAIPRGMTEQPVQPSGELAQPAPAPLPPRLVQNERRHQREADARHCLDQATTNRQIHRCSLKYRSHASREAPVKRASAKSSAAPPPAPAIVITKPPADIVKPGAPRPGDAAKAADIIKPMDVTKPSAVSKAPEPAKAAPSAPPPPPAKAPEPAKK